MAVGIKHIMAVLLVLLAGIVRPVSGGDWFDDNFYIFMIIGVVGFFAVICGMFVCKSRGKCKNIPLPQLCSDDDH